MKKIIYILLLCLVAIGMSFAQAPGAFKYQSVVRDNSGNIIANQLVKFRITLLRGSMTGTTSYIEQHTTATNQFGIANLEIGNGSSPIGNIDTIQWGRADYFIKVELDPTGSSGYTVMGTTQLLSVPYALYAEKSKKALNDNDTSATNELQNLSLVGNTLSISNGNSVNIGGTGPRIIAGSTEGTSPAYIVSGSGFTVAWQNQATWYITFNTPFTTIPTIVAGQPQKTSNDASSYALITNVTVNGFLVVVGNGSSGMNLYRFSFIAIGN